MYPHHDHSTIYGTVTGTLFTLIATIDLQDIFKTIFLAIIGATVSFVVTLFLKWIVRKIKK